MQQKIQQTLAAEGIQFLQLGNPVSAPEFERMFQSVCDLSGSADIQEVYGVCEEGKTTLFHVCVNGGVPKILRGTCQVLFEDLPLSELLQYRFEEDPEDFWRVASLSEYALDTYKSKAFDSWLHQLKEPSCEAAFRRLLQGGPISKVYDKHIFPTPAEWLPKYQVINEQNGKLIDIPHPVAALRIFDSDKKEYKSIDPTLVGAPRNDAETKIFWDSFLNELRGNFGDEYINKLLV